VAVESIATKDAALERVKALIPAGARVMTCSSTTLRQIGFETLLESGAHPWRWLKNEINVEKDPARRGELRKQSTLAEYYLGSVHAIAETGELVTASATGSQLPAYEFSSDHVIWVAGAQKIAPTLDDALRRVRDYVLPLEDKRMKSVGMGGSFIGKLLIFEREAPVLGRNLTLLLVNEVLGF
jgi:hypothetical protein